MGTVVTNHLDLFKVTCSKMKLNSISPTSLEKAHYYRMLPTSIGKAYIYRGAKAVTSVNLTLCFAPHLDHWLLLHPFTH